MGAVSDAIQQDATAAGVDPRWALAIAQTESRLNPAARNPSGATGVMQLMPATARSLGVNPLNPSQNIQGGVNLLAQDLKRYGNPVEASAAYFGGTNPANWGPKTRAYVEQVAANYAKDATPMATTQTQQADPSTAIQGFFSSMAPAQTPAAGSAATSTTAAPGTTPTQDYGGAIRSFFQSAAPKTKPVKTKGALASFQAGVEDVVRRPGEWLDNELHDTVVGNALNIPSAAQDQAMFNRDHQNLGTTAGDQAARFAGQALMAAPVLATGEGAVGAAADAAGGALDAAGAEGVGTVARGAGRLVTGNAGRAIGGIAGPIVRGASLAAQGALQGAGFNALAGGSPVKGAEVGAVAGPVLGAVGGALNSAGNRVINYLRPTSTKAAAIVRGALAADGMAPEDVTPAIGQHGNMLINTPGANVSALAQSLAHKPGPAAETIRTTLEGQADSAPEDMAQAVLQATGSKGDIHDLDDAIAGAQKAAAGPLYAKAYEANVPLTPELKSLLKRPAVAAAWQKAQNIAANEGHELPQIFKTDQNGNITGVEKTPDMQSWDYIKRGLDDVIASHQEPITGKVKTDAGRAVVGVKRDLLDTLDQLNPAYAEARAAYAGPAGVRDAIQAGRKALSQDSELTTRAVQNFSPSEKQAFQAGVARALMDKIESAPDGTNVARKLFGNEAIRKRIAAAFDSPEAFSRFQNVAEAKAAQIMARNDILKGSQTAARQAAQGHNWGTTLGHAIYEAAVGSPQRGALMLARQAALGARKTTNPALENAIANLLVNPNRGEVESALQSATPSAAQNLLTGATAGAGRAARLYGPVSLLTGPQAASQ